MNMRNKRVDLLINTVDYNKLPLYILKWKYKDNRNGFVNKIKTFSNYYNSQWYYVHPYYKPIMNL